MNEHNNPVAHPAAHTATPPTPPAPPTPPKAPKPDLTKVTPYVVTREGVPLTLGVFAGTRGNWDGVVYQAPQVSTDGTASLVSEDKDFIKSIQWFGKENVARMLNVVARRMSQDNWEDAIPEVDNQAGFPEGSQAGVFCESVFLKATQDFAASALKISELRELKDDAEARLTSALPAFIAAMTAAKNDDERKSAATDYQKLNDNLLSLKAQLEARMSKRSKEVNSEEVRPE